MVNSPPSPHRRDAARALGPAGPYATMFAPDTMPQEALCQRSGELRALSPSSQRGTLLRDDLDDCCIDRSQASAAEGYGLGLAVAQGRLGAMEVSHGGGGFGSCR